MNQRKKSSPRKLIFTFCFGRVVDKGVQKKFDLPECYPAEAV